MSTATRRYCSHCNAAFASSIDKCPRDGADLEARETNPLLGQVFGKRYRLVERLGAGGMGEVYRAVHVTIGKSFAIKVLLGEVGADNNMVARFHREAKSLSLLSHRNILSVADFGETEEGLLYLATEFVNGVSLSEAMVKEEFGPERTIHVVRQIAKALAHAHRRGLVHRDLKPDNVMLVQEDDEADVVKVLDFGIARVTEADDTEDAETFNRLTSKGLVMGTPAYIAPEQAMGSPVDHRADLYSLGILLYELLAGNVPFQAQSVIELMSKHLQQAPPDFVRQDITVEFKAVTMCLLEKKPDDRYQDADAFLSVLEQLDDAGGRYEVPTRPPTTETLTELAPTDKVSDTGTHRTESPADLPQANPQELPQGLQPEQRSGRTAAIAIAAAAAAAGAVLVVIYLRGSQAETASPTQPPLAVIVPEVAAPTVPDAAPPAILPTVTNKPDASVPRMDAAPLAPTSEPTRKAPPTQEALQAHVERMGKQMTTLAKTLDKSKIDSLRRKWLDLATTLPDMDNSVEARRRFSSKLRKLQNAIKKASRK